MTAHASIIAAMTAHAASGVSKPSSRPMPPAVSAAVTMKAANFGSRQPTPTRRISRPTSAKDVVLGVLNSVVAMSGSYVAVRTL